MYGRRWVCVAMLTVSFAWAQEVTLTARVELRAATRRKNRTSRGMSWSGLYRRRAR